MALQPHQRSAIPQSRARGSPLIPAGHRSSGSDDYPSIEEGRGTPHEPTEGLDPSSCWSDHSNPHDTTLGRLGGNTEPKGGIDALDKSSSPGSAGEGATPAEMLSAKLPASSPPTEASPDPKGIGLSVAASNSIAVNSRRDASSTQQRDLDAREGIQPTSDEALGAREPAQNLSVTPPPSPLLAAAGQPPAPVPLASQTTLCTPPPRRGMEPAGQEAIRIFRRLTSRQPSHPAFSSPPRATRHPRLSSRPRLLPLASQTTLRTPPPRLD